MYPSHLAQSSCSLDTTSIKPDKDIEYSAFAKINGDLESATTMPEKAAALHKNRQLWRTLAVAVADEANGLSVELRAQILSLAQFTDRRTSKILAGTEEIDVLIDINALIMHGLRLQKISVS